MLIFFYIFISGAIMLASLFFNSLVMFSFLVELSALLLLPTFFLEVTRSGTNTVYRPVVTFFIVTSFCGVLLLTGWVLNSLEIVLFAFCLKMGLFPLCGWLFDVYNYASWYIVVVLNTVYKLPLFYLCILSVGYTEFWQSLEIICFASFLYSSFLLQVLLSTWLDYLVVSGIVSSCILIMTLLGNNLGCFLILLTLSWCFFLSAYFFILRMLNETVIGFIGLETSWGFLFLLLSFPFSFAVLYKLCSAYCLIYLGCGAVFIVWCYYNFVEQLILLSLFLWESTELINLSETYNSRFGN